MPAKLGSLRRARSRFLLPGALALVAWTSSACSDSDSGSGTGGSGGSAGSAGSGGTSGSSTGGKSGAGGSSGTAGNGGSSGAGGSGGSSGTAGNGGSSGAGGSGGVDLDALGTPCVDDQCPPGLTPLKYCGFAGCDVGEMCSCEIPCSQGPAVCPPGTTCATISDGPGDVCVKT